MSETVVSIRSYLLAYQTIVCLYIFPRHNQMGVGRVLMTSIKYFCVQRLIIMGEKVTIPHFRKKESCVTPTEIGKVKSCIIVIPRARSIIDLFFPVKNDFYHISCQLEFIKWCRS